MEIGDFLVETPWDRRAFGIDTYEIREVSGEALSLIREIPGHFTAKVDPLSCKKLLHECGFYYCDTLIEPYCRAESLVTHKDGQVSISRDVGIDDLIAISHGAFRHGRFHRDFNIARELADLRYDNWLRDLHEAGKCFGLLYGGELAAFFGYNGSKIVLHAMGEKFRGKGLAKYLWSAGCEELFSRENDELASSVSASNLPVANLYASLGFRFRNPSDVYHRLNCR